MQKCVELSRIPRASSKGTKSLNLRRTTPGSVSSLLTRDPPWSRDLAIDTTHPAVPTYLSRNAPPFPACRNEFFGLRTFPKALLQKPEYCWPNPPYSPADAVCWEERVARENTNQPAKTQKANAMGISLMLVLGKKALHNKATIRRRVSKKLKVAMSLIITRGADAEPIQSSGSSRGKLQVVFRPELVKPDYILRDWTYVLYPQLPILLMPYPQLIKILRKSLDQVHREGTKLETQWTQVTREKLRKGSSRSLHAPDSTPEISSTRGTDEKVVRLDLASRASKRQVDKSITAVAALQNIIKKSIDRSIEISALTNLTPSTPENKDTSSIVDSVITPDTNSDPVPHTSPNMFTSEGLDGLLKARRPLVVSPSGRPSFSGRNSGRALSTKKQADR